MTRDFRSNPFEAGAEFPPPDELLRESILAERRFLHELSGPVSTSILLIDIMRGDLSASERDFYLTKLSESASQLQTLLVDRRSALIALASRAG